MVDLTNPPKNKTLFIHGSYLWAGLPDELSESEFIKRAGLKNLKEFRQYPFVTLVMDNPKKLFLVGHTIGRAIGASMMGHKKWQTMEWRN